MNAEATHAATDTPTANRLLAEETQSDCLWLCECNEHLCAFGTEVSREKKR